MSIYDEKVHNAAERFKDGVMGKSKSYHSVKIEEEVWKRLREFQMKRESLSEAISRLLRFYLLVSTWLHKESQNPEYQAWKEKKEVKES